MVRNWLQEQADSLGWGQAKEVLPSYGHICPGVMVSALPRAQPSPFLVRMCRVSEGSEMTATRHGLGIPLCSPWEVLGCPLGQRQGQSPYVYVRCRPTNRGVALLLREAEDS